MSIIAPLQVFIGYDKNEPIAYHVLAHSIMRRSSWPVSITPLYLPQLQMMKVYQRERSETESTEFSFTRFLTPWLANFSGPTIFMDCDMLCLGDICELAEIAMREPYKDVFVVKHDYTPKTESKFLGQKQTNYPCKNWSSLMLFNAHRANIRKLSPHYVSSASGADLHQLDWADTVGELPKEWNHLVGEYEPNPNAKLVHFTIGGPWFSEYEDCEYAKEWFEEADSALIGGNGANNIIFNSLSKNTLSFGLRALLKGKS